MGLPPLIDRELRCAARHPRTYRIRLITGILTSLVFNKVLRLVQLSDVMKIRTNTAHDRIGPDRFRRTLGE